MIRHYDADSLVRLSGAKNCGCIGGPTEQRPEEIIDMLEKMNLVEIRGDVLIVHDFSDHNPPVPPSLLPDARAAQKRKERLSKSTTSELSHATIANVATQEKRREEKKEDLKSLVEPCSTGEAQQVFEEWVKVHGKGKGAKFTPKRKRLVLARLKDYPVERLFAAIRGCKKSPHHQGQNQTATKYDDLALICRDGEHVEMFEGFNPKMAVLPPPPTKEQEEAQWKRNMEEADREMQSSRRARP
jgi:hypothetical protein